MADSANRQYTDPPFGLPGDYTSTGAMGSSGASGPPADETSTRVTPATGSEQDAYTASAGTIQPGQTSESVISPGPAADYASKGPMPDRGHTDPWTRYDWQATPDDRS